MIKAILGLILVLIPFILLSRFKEKKEGFFYVLTGIILFGVIISVITQLFHIFSYVTILLLYLLADCVIIFYIYKKDKGFRGLKGDFKKIKIDWTLIIVIIILFICLYSVHFNYSGKITTISEPLKEVNNMKLIYPYYSDEWVGVSFIKYSIENKALPFTSTLVKNSFFQNYEFATHSFLSQIIVLFGLDFLESYSILSLFFGLLICILSYFVLRINDVKKIPAGIATLTIPYITNGVNLPGIWYLLPVTLGLVCFLIGIVFISYKNFKMSLLLGFLALLFYPPLFVLYTFSIIAFLIFSSNSKKEKMKFIGIYFLICFIVAIIISIFLIVTEGYSYALKNIIGKIFYNTFTMNGIPDYSIWKIIPIPVLILSVIGLFKYFKKKMILSIPVIIGLLYWLLYSRVLFRIVIEYQRVVFVTSILLALFAGLGLDFLFTYLSEKKYFKEYKIVKILGILIIAFLFILSFNYTKMNNWSELKLYGVYTNEVASPNAPATSYLTSEDLKIFENIKNKTFISLPWKGLVIGTATGNYPIETKPSTITVRVASYLEFISGDCQSKLEFSRKYNIDFAYTPEFNCTEGFKFIEKSSEGLYLYEVIK